MQQKIANASAGALHLGQEKLPDAVAKVRNPVAVETFDPATKVGKCLCIADYRKEVLPNIFKKKIAEINLGDLARFEAGGVVDEAALVRCGLVKGKRDGIKLLGNGDISIALTVKINAVSRSAKEKIEAAGGSVEVI